MCLLFISYVKAQCVVDESCLCLPVAVAPLANFGRRKVVLTHPCTFDCRFRSAEPGMTVMGVCYRQRRKPCLGCFLGVLEGDLS